VNCVSGGGTFFVPPALAKSRVAISHARSESREEKSDTQCVLSPSFMRFPTAVILSILCLGDFYFLPQQDVSDRRASCPPQMADYLKNLIKGRRVFLSDSIVRRFSVHDRQHFTIEQMVTISVTGSPQGWMDMLPHISLQH
jgi:hypothetical protein